MYEAVFRADQTDDTERLRSLGRRAGRRRDINVATWVSRPDVDGEVLVTITNVTPVAEDDELGQRRQWARLRAAVDSVPPATSLRLFDED